MNRTIERGLLMKISEIIVVEGKNDTHKIKQAVNADTIETNGAGMTKETIALIRLAQKKRGVIIFTDPDFAGNKIRERINQVVPGCKHAYLPKSEATPKNNRASVGIEHASHEAIREALQHVHEVAEVKFSDVSRADLVALGLIGTSDAKEKRELLGAHLHIGYANAKQLLKRLQLYNISRNELKDAMMRILEGGNEDE